MNTSCCRSRTHIAQYEFCKFAADLHISKALAPVHTIGANVQNSKWHSGWTWYCLCSQRWHNAESSNPICAGHHRRHSGMHGSHSSTTSRFGMAAKFELMTGNKIMALKAHLDTSCIAGTIGICIMHDTVWRADTYHY